MSNILIKLTKSLKGDVQNNYDQCLYCGKCEKRCRPKAIVVNSKTKEWLWNTDKCIRCGHCVEECPVKSLSFKK